MAEPAGGDVTSSIALAVDSRQVNDAADDLTRFERAGIGAQTAAQGLAAQMSQASTSAGAAAAGFSSAGRGLDNLVNQQAKLAANTRYTAQQMQQLSFQLNDFFVQLASGGNPLTAFIQQGSQLNGTFGGTAGTLKALGSLITPVRLALGGFTGVLAAVALGYKAGADESDEFVRSIVLTGNAAGATVGQLQEMSRAASAAGGTQGAAAEAVARFAASARVGATEIEKISRAAIGLQRAGGPAVEEIAKQFESLGKNPAQAAAALNERTNFLTASIYAQIVALEEQGRTVEAAALAQSRFADVLASRTVELEANLGSIERGWLAIKDAIKGAGDALASIGRADTTEAQIRALQTRLQSARTGIYSRDEVPALERQLELLNRAAFREAERAGLARTKNEAEAAGITLLQKQNALLDNEAKKRREIAEVRTLAAKSRQGDGAGLSAEKEAALVDAINKKYEEKDRVSERAAKAQRKLVESGVELARGLELQKAGLDSGLIDDFVKLGAAYNAGAISLAEMAAAQDQLLAKSPAAIASAKAEKEAREATQKVFASIALLELDAADDLAKQAQQQEEFNRTIGKTTAELRQLEIAKIDDAQATAQQRLQDALRAGRPAEEISGIELQIAGLQRLRKAKEQAFLLTDDAGLQAKATKAAEDARKVFDALFDPTKAQTFGEALKGAFGGAGEALTRLTVTLEAFGKKQAEIEKARDGLSTSDNLYERYYNSLRLAGQEQENHVELYRDMAGAAKGFFKEGSDGYRTLSSIEAAFTIAQLAGSFARGTALAAEGVASQAQGDPYSAFARMAAMAAAMAQLGFSTGFFGASGSSNLASASSRQGGAATGRVVTAADLNPNSASFVRGTVLGDGDARSDSIVNAIEELEKAATIGNTYSRGMLDSLKNIESSIVGLGNVLFRAAGGGLTTGRNLGIQTGLLSRNEGDPILKALGFNDSGVIQSLANSGSILGKLGVFGQSLWGKVTQEVVDSGLSIVGTIAELIAGQGVQQFADVATTTSSFFGLRKKTTTGTQFAEVEDVVAEQFGLVFASIGDTLKASAQVLGRDAGDALQTAIENFPIKIDRLSLKGLEGEELQNALNAAIGAASDEMAALLVPGLNDFQQIGEGYYETLVRVASGIEVANSELELLGITAIDYSAITRKQGDVTAEIIRQSIVAFETAGGVVSSVGEIVSTLNGNGSDLSSTYRQLIDVREALVLVGESGESLTVSMIRGAGGLDKLGTSLNVFFEKFFSPQEQAAANSARLADQFERLGLTMPATRKEFRELADGLNDGTESGAKLFAAVIGLAEAFDKAIAPAEALTKTLINSITEALPKFLSPAQLTDFRFGNIASGLKEAGVNVSAAQLRGASMDDILAFARSFVDLSDGASEAEIAVVRAASALADLKGEAAAASQQLEDAIAQNLPRLLSPDAQRTFRFQQIQSDLQDVGVSIGLDKLMGASKAQILAFAQSFINLADGASAAEIAVANAAGALGTLIDESQTASDTRQKTLADAFDDLLDGLKRGVQDAYADVSQIIGSERQRLESEAEKSINELEQKADKVQQTYSGLVESLGSSLRQLMGDLAGDGGQAQAVGTLRRALVDLRGGGTVDADSIRDAASTAARLETTTFASALEFRRAQTSTATLIREVSEAASQRQTTELGAIAAQQVKIEFELKKQTDSLDDQLKQARSSAGSLVSIDDGVKSVAGAIDRLGQAMAAARAATGGGPTGQWVSSGGADALSSAGGAVALRETGAKVEDSIVKGLKTSFTIADARAFVADRLAAGDIVGIYARARAEGIDSSTLDTLMGWAPGTSLGEALRRGLPAFEFGSAFVPETGLAVVHKGERVLTATQNQEVMRMLKGGSDQSAVEAAVRELIAAVKVADDRNVNGHAANAANTGKSARLLDGVTNGSATLRTEVVS